MTKPCPSCNVPMKEETDAELGDISWNSRLICENPACPAAPNPKDKQPDFVHDDVWAMVCGYLAAWCGPNTQKHANGLLTMLYKMGFEIQRVDLRKRKKTKP